MNIKRGFSTNDFLILLALICFGYATYIAIYYAHQPPLDLYSFRQSQTALTSYWLGKNGFSFAYETPVLGSPWSIPFEFPIYQYMVALVSKVLGISLDLSGRVISFIFLVLCIIPIRSITKSLKLSPTVFYIFTALLFSSPVYLYWGRTFMIETTAIFFTVVSIKYFIDMMNLKNVYKYAFLFALFMTLSILQKATTGLPILAVLCAVYAWVNIKKITSLSFYINGIFLLIPLVIGAMWTAYTDQIKAFNEIGAQLSSSSLSQWNWGTLSQRFSSALYVKVLGIRIFHRNLAGILGIALLLFAFFSNAKGLSKNNFPFFRSLNSLRSNRTSLNRESYFLTNPKRSIKWIVGVATCMGLLPLFLFPNLHIVHDYYQAANIIFLLYALSVSLGQIINVEYDKKRMVCVLTVIIVASNILHFSLHYLRHVKQTFNAENSRDYAVSAVLKKEIPEGKYFVAFGNDWSSTFSYLSERKSVTVPGWFLKYDEVSLHPDRLFDQDHLGGVVLCPTISKPTLNDFMQWSKNKQWEVQEIHGCYLSFPKK